MDSMIKALTVFSIPLGLINMFGGLVSGIWLAILGEWGLIGIGILALFVSSMGIGLAMMPGMIFALPAMALLEKGKKISGYFFGFLSTLYTTAVLVVWCIAVLLYFVKHADHGSIIPILIWSYGIAIGPISWLAQKDRQGGNEHAMVSTFFIQVAYLITILGILFLQVTVLNVTVLIGVIMSVALILQFSLAFLSEQSSRDLY